MVKRVISLLMVLVLVLGLAACGGTTTPTTAAPTTAAPVAEDDFKIGILTGTVSQNEEEYRAAQNVLAEYGEDMIVHMTYPDKFMDEQETTISNIVSMASDPKVKALVIVQAVPGVAAGIARAREIRDDLLIIAGVPGEDPSVIAPVADIVVAIDELSTGLTIIEQAVALGAKTFVHYSFPRHMSYALLAARRDLFKENCELLGIEFVDATAPDPTGDSGLTGAQQFILEDVPRKVAEYGKDTAFFATNCGMQVPLITQVVEYGAIYPIPCCPSPTHGFPSALGLSIPDDKKGDMPYIIELTKEAIAEKGGTGRLSNWPVPISMMFTEGGAAYAIEWAKGNTTGKVDIDQLKASFEGYTGTAISMTELNDGGTVYDNYFMIMLDFVTY